MSSKPVYGRLDRKLLLRLKRTDALARQRLDGQFEALTALVRLRRCEVRMDRFSKTRALAGEIDKLFEEIEGDAEDIMTKQLAAVRAKKQLVMQKAKDKTNLAVAAIGEASAALDALDQALSNSPPAGGSAGSSGSPAAEEHPETLRPLKRIDL